MEKIKKYINEKYQSILIMLFGIAGLGSLALSNITINSINLVQSTIIGITYFGFVLFNLLAFFSSTQIKKFKTNFICMAIIVLCIALGLYSYNQLITTYVKGDIFGGKLTFIFIIALDFILLIGLVINIIREKAWKKSK